MNELQKDIVRLMKIFPGSFINHQLELILIPKYNIYFRMDNVETVEELKCKVLEYLSRPSCKGVRSSEQKLFRGRVNSFLETSFGEEDMVTIYTCLGNSCDRERTIAFIRGGFDLAILSGDMDSEKSGKHCGREANMERSDALLALIENVHPVGETNTDDRRYENLKLACDVLKHLVCAVREVSVKCEGHGAYSINRAGEYARKCLEDLNIPTGYRDE